jgi:hypothetical protein
MQHTSRIPKYSKEAVGRDSEFCFAREQEKEKEQEQEQEEEEEQEQEQEDLVIEEEKSD